MKLYLLPLLFVITNSLISCSSDGAKSEQADDNTVAIEVAPTPQTPSSDATTAEANQAPQNPNSDTVPAQTEQTPQIPSGDTAAPETVQTPQTPSGDTAAPETEQTPQTPSGDTATPDTEQAPQTPNGDTAAPETEQAPQTASSDSTAPETEQAPQTPSDNTATPQTETEQTSQAPSMVQVTFDITVPVYKSNKLRVDVVWDETKVTAKWHNDEYWSASGEFPTDSQASVTITFSDNNGDIALASLTQAFTTAAKDTQSIQISAEQFNYQQYDNDGDGISNLDELQAGSDPLMDDTTQLEVRDSVSIPSRSMFISQELEEKIKTDRPYTENLSEFIPYREDDDSTGTTNTTDIDIDADGNGTYSYSSWAPWYNETHTGSRSNSGKSIRWEGSFSSYDGDYRRRRTFVSEVTFIDKDTRDFFEELSETYSGTFKDTWDISSQLTGEPIEGTSLCKPTHGSMTFSRGTNRNGSPFNKSTTTISKKQDDQFWHVVFVDDEGVTSEYSARKLISDTVRTDFQVEQELKETPSFVCEFVD